MPNQDIESMAGDMERALLSGHTDAIDNAFIAAGAPAPKLHLDPTHEVLQDEVLEGLHQYWTGLCEQARARTADLPLTASFDPLEVHNALPYTMLLDVLDGGADFRYRVYGREIAARFGRDMTRLKVSEVGSMPHITAFFLSVYRVSMKRRCAVLSQHAPPAHVSVTSWRRLIMPLDDGSGAVARFVVGNIPGQARSHAREISSDGASNPGATP